MLRRLLVICFLLVISITMVSYQMSNQEDVNINLDTDGPMQSLKVGVVNRMVILTTSWVITFGCLTTNILILRLNS